MLNVSPISLTPLPKPIIQGWYYLLSGPSNVLLLLVFSDSVDELKPTIGRRCLDITTRAAASKAYRTRRTAYTKGRGFGVVDAAYGPALGLRWAMDSMKVRLLPLPLRRDHLEARRLWNTAGKVVKI